MDSESSSVIDRAAVLEREAHRSLQRAKDQAASCTQCSWRRAISGGSTAGADIKGCRQCMGSWYAKARLTQYNNPPEATSQQRWYLQKELCQVNALAEDPEETQKEVAQVKQETQVKKEGSETQKEVAQTAVQPLERSRTQLLLDS